MLLKHIYIFFILVGRLHHFILVLNTLIVCVKDLVTTFNKYKTTNLPKHCSGISFIINQQYNLITLSDVQLSLFVSVYWPVKLQYICFINSNILMWSSASVWIVFRGLYYCLP